VPRIQSEALKAAGVPESVISIIPDEQDAIDAALRMGEAGDLILIFADALTRSWKQVTKFKPSGAAVHKFSASLSPQLSASESSAKRANGASTSSHDAGVPGIDSPAFEFALEGLIRDERGVRMAPEGED
jgi:cyanophycin synthetase